MPARKDALDTSADPVEAAVAAKRIEIQKNNPVQSMDQTPLSGGTETYMAQTKLRAVSQIKLTFLQRQLRKLRRDSLNRPIRHGRQPLPSNGILNDLCHQESNRFEQG
jgi:hypothetical protein